MLKKLKLLWDFTRPHTIIGSFLSITTLFLLACKGENALLYWPVYAWTLLAALGCNVFITGLNQITDWEMDKINKPFLPIPAGRLSLRGAWQIIVVGIVVCLLSAWQVSANMSLIMALILGLGTAYSLPPIRLKRHHISAAFCIVAVRGVLVNLAIGAELDRLIVPGIQHWPEFILLSVFVSVFSLAIAWFKDLYDTKGDAQYQIRTFPLLYSARYAFIMGNLLVMGAYLLAIGYGYRAIQPHSWLLSIGHGALLAAFIGHVLTSSIATPEGTYRFYMRFWVFFFAEYLLMLGYGVG
jgi:homogentisate phytyltransferase / homogentisate geranylgeranyltransferase